MWKIIFSMAIISTMSTLQGCDGMSVKPHKTSVTYGVAEIDKDNDSKDSVKESFTVKQDFIWEEQMKNFILNLLEVYGSKISNWAWHKRWNKRNRK